jgi:hypothetical protein
MQCTRCALADHLATVRMTELTRHFGYNLDSSDDRNHAGDQAFSVLTLYIYTRYMLHGNLDPLTNPFDLSIAAQT